MYYLFPLTTKYPHLWEEYIKIQHELPIDLPSDPIKDVWFLYNVSSLHRQLNTSHLNQRAGLVEEEQNMYVVTDSNIPFGAGASYGGMEQTLTLPINIEQYAYSYIVIFTQFSCILARYGRTHDTYGEEERIHYIQGFSGYDEWRCSLDDIRNPEVIPDATIRSRIEEVWRHII